MRKRANRLKIAIVVAGMTGASVALATTSAAATTHRPNTVHPMAASGTVRHYSNGFEKNLHGWCNGVDSAPCDGQPGNWGSIIRVKSGTSNAPYGGYISASSGNYYAVVSGTGDTASGCPTFNPWPAGDESCVGPYTTFSNKDADYTVWPKNGFQDSLDVYIDTGWAANNPGNEFEWDTGLNAGNDDAPNDGFLQDFIFTAETQNPSPGVGNFVVGYTSNTTNDPSSGGGGLGSFTPAILSTSGWYTFTTNFTPTASGNVEATMSISQGATTLDSFSTVTSWVVGSAANANNPDEAGGPAYGLFPNENIPGLPIDNTVLTRDKA
jgi:hypothetical protein